VIVHSRRRIPTWWIVLVGLAVIPLVAAGASTSTWIFAAAVWLGVACALVWRYRSRGKRDVPPRHVV
jgi:tellurite resistance protein TehA-like permease